MQKTMRKVRTLYVSFQSNARRVMQNEKGDQITGWLIVILLVVVVGAFFLNTYQSAIIDIWEGIVDKMKDTFGI